jgi:hypothetical protein
VQGKGAEVGQTQLQVALPNLRNVCFSGADGRPVAFDVQSEKFSYSIDPFKNVALGVQ